LAAGLEPWENPRIPSGYTYFAQFVAHDCVQSALPTAALQIGGRGTPRNLRSKALELDTVYGAGFDGCRHAERHLDAGQSRSAKLPLGRLQDTRTASAKCPFRDLPRTAGEDGTVLTKVSVADDRNDNNVIVAQMTVLFSMLHNAIVDMLGAAMRHPINPHAQGAILHTAARRLCSRIYRRLVTRDLMRKLLHPAIYARYTSGSTQFIDQDTSDSIAIEFPIVLRFGHAMVRPRYRFNDIYDRREDLIDVLLTTSRGRPWRLPLDESWAIQWSNFFAIGDNRPNLSKRIGPCFSADLVSDVVFAGIDETNCAGIAYRDLLQGTATSTWSVTALIDELRKHAPDVVRASRMLDDDAYREPVMRQWLSGAREATGLSTDAIADLSRDPPLILFVLLEAAHECEGAHLGMLGSLMVAEIVFRAAQDPRRATGGVGIA
jgi:Animal haem peroxidase